ncbi:MAG TPA: acetate/propionate family kinase [Ktedonobacterales bacterium]
MAERTRAILTINCGSSSVKFSLYRASSAGGDPVEDLIYAGAIERIGLPDGAFTVTDAGGAQVVSQPFSQRDHAAALWAAITWLEKRPDGRSLDAIGHRLVHGGATFSQPERISDVTLEALRRLAPLAPLHLPVEIAAIEALRSHYPSTPQVACFDTAFHRTMPEVAQTYGLERAWLDKGVRRYGFHGLSYEYILSDLARRGAIPERVIIAHLGNGASMVAARAGRSIETTMGFTPTGGLVMSARSGDLDPGVMLYLMETGGLTLAQTRDAVEKTGGLLGVSGTSGDMRDLLARSGDDPRAAAAVELFCYTARKCLGGLVSVLGGLDLLVFTGGIGEHAAEVRRRICEGVEFMGLRLDPERHEAGAGVISADESPISAQVIPTNEDLMIARHTARALGFT